MTTLVVMAKECVPGRVKTRLHPPYSLEQAARVAEASLGDTLAFGATLPVHRRILCFAGSAVPAAAKDYEVVPQASGSLDVRIAEVLDCCDGATILIGMDTPQLRPEDLGGALTDWPADVDAFLGPAADGGFWALALREPRGALVRGVVMSAPDTGVRQRERLTRAGLRVLDLDEHVDIDTADTLAEVAAQLPPGSRVREALRSMESEER